MTPVPATSDRKRRLTRACTYGAGLLLGAVLVSEAIYFAGARGSLRHLLSFLGGIIVAFLMRRLVRWP